MIAIRLIARLALGIVFANTGLLAVMQATGQALNSAGTIAFVSDQAGNDNVYLLDILTRTRHPLTEGPAEYWSPAWSPDGAQIAYSANGQIFVRDVFGGATRQLTYSGVNSWPAWSPDGQWLAYASNQIVFDPVAEHVSTADLYDIYVMSATCDTQLGGCDQNATRVTEHPFSSMRPVWSPDGSALLYHAGLNGDQAILRLDLASGETEVISDLLPSAAWASWSPDGRQIAAMVLTRDGYEIFVMDAAGSNPRRLTVNTVSDGVPTWLPDGSGLTYYAGTDGAFDLYLMNRDGSNVTRLTDSPGNDMFPVWQP